MKTIGVRELKANISAVLRQVEEDGEVVEVTRHGHVVVRLVPAHNSKTIDRDANGVWTELNTLVSEISALWPEDISAREAVDDVRRDF